MLLTTAGLIHRNTIMATLTLTLTVALLALLVDRATSHFCQNLAGSCVKGNRVQVLVLVLVLMLVLVPTDH